MAINIAGNTVINDSGRFFLPSMLSEIKVAMGANNIDLAAGTAFTKTITGATTFTVSNTPASGKVGSFILEVTTTVASPAITWWAGVKWAGGTAPTLAVINTPNSFAFYTHDGGTTWNGMLIGKDFFLAPIGEAVYTTEGTYSWVAPASVTSVCIVCVGGGSNGSGSNPYSGTSAGGGGALAYLNNTTVVPGNSYSIIVGVGGTSTVTEGTGGSGGNSSGFGCVAGGSIAGQGGFFQSASGGSAGLPSGTYTGGNFGGQGGNYNTTYSIGGGGGAGGYSGGGGHGYNAGGGGAAPTAGSGGGGGGGDVGQSGGGVGLYGQGTNGARGVQATTLAGGGSGGTSGAEAYPSNGGIYGGGSCRSGSPTTGGKGGVRIIWGPGRSFPSNAA